MNTELSPQAAKYLKRLNEPDKSRIIKALRKLELEPPQGDIKSLAGKDGYRLRIGDYRACLILLTMKYGFIRLPQEGKHIKGVFKCQPLNKRFRNI
jgi:hypothetical protein